MRETSINLDAELNASPNSGPDVEPNANSNTESDVKLDAGPNVELDAGPDFWSSDGEPDDAYPHDPSGECSGCDEGHDYPFLLESRSSDDSEEDTSVEISGDETSEESDDEPIVAKTEEDSTDDSYTELQLKPRFIEPESDDLSEIERDIKSEEDEYDEDPELLENSDNDSAEEAEEAAEEELTSLEIIRASKKDLAAAMGYVHDFVYVYKKLGIYKGKFAAEAELLHDEFVDAINSGLIETLNGKDEDDSCSSEHDEKDAMADTGSEQNNASNATELWEKIDTLIDHLWEFVEKYSGYPPHLKQVLIQLRALDSVEYDIETEDSAGEPFHQYTFNELAVDSYFDWSSDFSLMEFVCTELFQNEVIFEDFLDPNFHSYDDRDLNKVVNSYRELEIISMETRDRFRMKFPFVWKECLKKDQFFDDYTAYEEVCAEQQRATPLIPQKRLDRLIQEVLDDVTMPQRWKAPYRIDEEGMAAIRMAAEDFLVETLAGSQLLAAKVANRTYINPRDLATFLSTQSPSRLSRA